MYRYTIVRPLEVPMDFAFSWLTDYRADDMIILGGKPGSREIEQMAPTLFHVRNRFLNSKRIYDMVVTISPPDSWVAKGTVLDRERPVVDFTQAFKLERVSEEVSRLTLTIESRPLTVAARVYEFFRWGIVIREVKRQCALFAEEVSNDYRIAKAGVDPVPAASRRSDERATV